MNKAALLFAAVVSIADVSPSQACTALCAKDGEHVVVGKNYDWFFRHGHGAVFVNPRGVDREALNLDNSPNPAKWTSKYGSVTFTQFGKALPIGGMNEKGLVVEMLQLDSTKFNSSEVAKPFVNESQWTQFQLDQYATTEEVVKNIERLRIVKAFVGIHYFIADAKGDVATVEFLNGKPVVHYKDTLPAAALTNDTYDEALNYSKKWKYDPWLSKWRRSSERRFAIAAEFANRENMDPFSKVSNALMRTKLDGSAPDALLEPTQWQIEYSANDPRGRSVRFQTRTLGTRVHNLNFDKLDFSKGAPVLVMDMNAIYAVNAKGEQRYANTSHDILQPFTDEFNKKLIYENRFLLGRKKCAQALEYGKR